MEFAVGKNFSKTLNCYLLIKYWFKITSFLGDDYIHRCIRNSPFFLNLFRMVARERAVETILPAFAIVVSGWKNDVTAENSKIWQLFVHWAADCVVSVVLFIFLYVSLERNAFKYCFVCFGWHTSPVIISYNLCMMYAHLKCAHTPSKTIVMWTLPLHSPRNMHVFSKYCYNESPHKDQTCEFKFPNEHDDVNSPWTE